MEIAEIFSLTLFWQKFRESNISTKEITKELISRIFLLSEREFLVFPYCGKANHDFNDNFYVKLNVQMLYVVNFVPHTFYRLSDFLKVTHTFRP